MTRREVSGTLKILALAAMGCHFIFKDLWLVYAATALLALSFTDNRAAKFIASAWMGFADAFGAISSRIILVLVFYALLTPLAMLYRLFNKKEMLHFTTDARDTMFDDVPPQSFSKESFEKPW